MGRSGRLNEKATFENRLENAEEGVRFGPQACAKALFRLPENVIEIGTDQSVGATAEDDDQVAELAFPDECEAVLGQIEGGFHAAVRGLEFGIEIADPLLDPPRGNMAAGIVMSIRNEAPVLPTEQVGFFHLVAMSALEDDVVIGA